MYGNLCSGDTVPCLFEHILEFLAVFQANARCNSCVQESLARSIDRCVNDITKMDNLIEKAMLPGQHRCKPQRAGRRRTRMIPGTHHHEHNAHPPTTTITTRHVPHHLPPTTAICHLPPPTTTHTSTPHLPTKHHHRLPPTHS